MFKIGTCRNHTYVVQFIVGRFVWNVVSISQETELFNKHTRMILYQKLHMIQP